MAGPVISPVVSPSGGMNAPLGAWNPVVAPPTENGMLPGTPVAATGGVQVPIPAVNVPTVTVVGTGVMTEGDYADGSGQLNPNVVDHAKYADASDWNSLLHRPPLGKAAAFDVPAAGGSATSQQLVRGDDPRLGVSGPTVSGTNGASAYDVAVANGFVGTPQQWLQSLKGPQGIPGSIFLGTYDNLQQAQAAGLFNPDGVNVRDGDVFFLATGQIYRVKA